MRVIAVFLAGLALGVVLTFAVLQISASRYTYFILPPEACRRDYGNAVTAEVVPHQPNPCHFRRPRW